MGRLRAVVLLLFLVINCAFVSAQNIVVKGHVTDAATNDALIGVSIVQKGSTVGTTTDADGSFSINVGPSAILQVSYVGYTTKEIKVEGRKTIEIQLSEDLQSLEEMVVVGYGTQKKATLSGAVTSVKGEQLASVPVTNVSQGIAGRLPGVVAVSSTAEPGYDGTTIRIRGVNTFGNSSPLIVVDGVPGRSLERIDPNTIESMSVLKDASAAIYGAQAANGVILITTKKGKSGAPSVDLSYNYGLAQPTSLPKMTDAAEYATLMNEIDVYAGGTPRFSAEDIELYRNGSDPWGHPNTDWFKETLRTWSPQSDANVSISGGAEKVKYFVSLSTKNQEAFYKNTGANYKQYDLKGNLDISVNKYIDVYTYLTARMEDRKYPTRSSENIFRMIMRSKPNSPAYWPDGTPGPDVEFGDNPVVICTNATGYDRDKRYTYNADLGINIKIPGVEGLSVKATASLDKFNQFNKTWQTPWYLYSWDGSRDSNGNPVLTSGKKGFTDARLTESSADNLGIMTSGIINYTRTFAHDHDVTAMAGVERISNKGDSFQAFRRYFLSTAIDQLFAGGTDEMNNTGTGFEEARLNYFGRLNYAYKTKYLAEFVWRYQGSYIFDKQNKWGFFPGVSLGYVISQEDFWKEHMPLFSYAKLRASWGQTGNDMIDPFQYMSSYSFGRITYLTGNGLVNNQALIEGVAPNKNVTWETAVQKNIGIDLQMFDGDLALTVDYFHNKRTDILWARNASVPATSGISLPDENLGKVVNQGVDFNIDYRKTLGEWTFGANFNGVYSKNKILFWDEAPGALDYQKSTGYPIGSSLLYNAIGIFKDQASIDSYPHWSGARPGDIIFEDYNNDGVIDGNDRVRENRNRIPRFTYGVNLSAKWRNLDLSVLLQGAAGGTFYEATEAGDFANFTKRFYDNRWTTDNVNASYPRTYNRTNEYWVNQNNTFWLHSSDYLRLKTVELGYTLPSAWSRKIGVEKLRLHMSGYNLLTIAPDMDDFDPEAPANGTSAGYYYPLSRVINFGLNINF